MSIFSTKKLKLRCDFIILLKINNSCTIEQFWKYYMFYTYKENVFDSEFCDHLINTANSIGFEAASVDMYGRKISAPNIRNNERLEFNNLELSRIIETTILKKINFPKLINGKSYKYISSHFRFYCYSPGQYFKPHKDGSYEEGDNKTFMTCLIYLNDTDGGETILMPEGFKHRDKWIIIKPSIGSVLLFEHGIWHEGKEVIDGKKYVLRTDIFFG